ncbi:hypothetical protein GCM10010873_01700 [Cypionkella aquatica]|uniref:Transglycosylase SLT domain-containing protein n=2 Tax=Cypionkella aquatica TaxID=1756042 RepID=A0AA37TV84_9RHOB|nr:hypothetical protein GCM10010873_01700 [Cypionkella aquatica]
MNQAGQGYWFDDATKAINFADDLLAKGEDNYDVGCFQINMHWHGKNFDSTEAMFDPEINARYAAEFLTELFVSEGGWPQAVAAYHSRSPEQAEGYLVKVEAALNELRGTGAALPADEAQAMSIRPQISRNNNFPLLQAGSRGVGASLVPMTAGNPPLFAAVP